MRKEKGITLVALVIYIIVMIVVITVLGIIINKFYKNTDTIQEGTEEILEFSRFNTYFLKEIKAKANNIDSIGDNGEYILFSSGNSFSFKDNKIYYNTIEISNNVDKLVIKQGKDGDGINKEIIYVTVKINNFTKSINYKLEEIY